MNSEQKTQIKIALIGLIGVLATAILSNWEKIFKPTVYSVPSAKIEKKEPLQNESTSVDVLKLDKCELPFDKRPIECNFKKEK